MSSSWLPGPLTKAELTRSFAALTGMPLPEVRQRIRSLFVAGIGPRGRRSVSDRALADILIGFMAPTHLEAATFVGRYGRFVVASIDGPSEVLPIGQRDAVKPPSGVVLASIEALAKLLPPLSGSTLQAMLTGVLRGIADMAPYELVFIQATWPPHERFRICLRSHEGVTLELTFRPSSVVGGIAPKDAPTSWPIETSYTMSGDVPTHLARFTVPDPFDDDEVTATSLRAAVGSFRDWSRGPDLN